MSNITSYAIYGIGGFGREVAPVALDWIAARLAATPPGDREDKCPVVFVDDSASRPEHLNDIPVIGFDELVSPCHRHRKVVVAIGDGRTREKVEQKCVASGLIVGSLIANSSKVMPKASIAGGAVICDNTIIMPNVKIGKSFQCNIFSYVAHDCIIGDYVTFAPAVRCNGNIVIENYAYIGTGAVFSQGKVGAPLVVGEGAVVGMGAVVTKSVDPYTVIVGNPARAIKTLQRPSSE